MMITTMSTNMLSHVSFSELFRPKRRPIIVCLSMPVSTPSTSNAFLHTLPLTTTVPWKIEERDEKKRRECIVEETRKRLITMEEGEEKILELIDTIQRLGLCYYMKDEINEALKKLMPSMVIGCCNNGNEGGAGLYATALCFRLLRSNGFSITPDVFLKFTDENGKFKESLAEDIAGLLSLYEASYMGASDEQVLCEATAFTEKHLNLWLSSAKEPSFELELEVKQALELPRHLRMGRLETRRFIEQYASMQIDISPTILELSILDYNKVQSQHQSELIEVTRWWRELGLVDKLGFARDRPLECFLWTVGLLPDPKYSTCRVELAKTIAILLVIDDIFDTYGKMDELQLFTQAIQRWDLEAMECLPEYMKVCYMALYNTINEICYKILKAHGWNVLPFLKLTWIDMIEGFMAEAKWFTVAGVRPNLEEYIENGVSTAGAYMALTHLFFLMGEGITPENSRLLKKPYPKLFSHAGRILRLWDDLGTAKEEQERGDEASSIRLFMREKGVETEEEGRKGVLEEINRLWRDLNGELRSENAMPICMVNVALDMARASQVVYKHEGDTYFSGVDSYVEALFFTPLTL